MRSTFELVTMELQYKPSSRTSYMSSMLVLGAMYINCLLTTQTDYASGMPRN